MSSLSIIIPAYNEENLLAVFLEELSFFLRKFILPFELIIVENGSHDKTLEIANYWAKKDKRIKVIHLSKPGYGQALIKGMKIAMGDYIVIYNVDFWDVKFINICKVDLLGYDIVTGSKNLSLSQDERPFSRRIVTRFFSLLLRILFKYKGTDTHGIKTIRRKAIASILNKCKTRTGIFDTELLVRSQRKNLKILELPVDIKEIRPNRFGLKRLLETPKDLLKLYLALRS